MKKGNMAGVSAMFRRLSRPSDTDSPSTADRRARLRTAADVIGDIIGCGPELLAPPAWMEEEVCRWLGVEYDPDAAPILPSRSLG